MSNNLNAAGLISSLPAILGYQVTDSIVAVMLKRHDGQEVIDVVLRVSIDCSTEEIATMPQAAARSARNTAGAILIAVAGGDHDTHAGDLRDALRNSLIDLDIPVRTRLSVPTTAEPSLWTDIDTGRSGITAAWTDSTAAAERVFHGKAVAASREALVAEFAPAEPATPQAHHADMESLIHAGEELAAIIAGTGQPNADLASRLATAITLHPRLRDAHLLLGLDHTERTAALWTGLARHMRGLARAHAATIAGFYYYLAGDGPRTGIAIDTANRSATATGNKPLTLTALLDSTLQAGISPHELRSVAIEALAAEGRT